MAFRMLSTPLSDEQRMPRHQQTLLEQAEGIQSIMGRKLRKQAGTRMGRVRVRQFFPRA
jgi:hypothetical protein